MAKLKIYTFPDLILKQKAKPIERVDKSYRQLADDMLETMYSAPGIGLAANQIGLLEKIIVLDTEYESEDMEDEDGNPVKDLPEGDVINGKLITGKKSIIIINPKIIYKEGKQTYKEGCLSVPEFTEDVERFDKIRIEYLNIDGLTKTLDAEELLSVCIQHEMDHLVGKLFIDRLSPLKQEIVKKKLLLERNEREAEEAEL